MRSMRDRQAGVPAVGAAFHGRAMVRGRASGYDSAAGAADLRPYRLALRAPSRRCSSCCSRLRRLPGGEVDDARRRHRSKVVGKTRADADRAAEYANGDAGRGQGRLRREGLRRLPHAGATPARRARSGRTSTTRSRDLALAVDRVVNGKGAMPPFKGYADRRSRSPTSRPTSSRHERRRLIELPADFPRDVARRRDGPRPHADLARQRAASADARGARRRARDAGLHVIVVTGRMVQSLRRGSCRAGPRASRRSATRARSSSTPTGTWLRHVPIELELAKEAIAARRGRGLRAERLRRRRALRLAHDAATPRRTRASRASTIHVVGDVVAWLDRAADEARLRRRPGRRSTGSRRG